MRERRGRRGRRKHKRRKEGGEQNNNRNKLHMHLIYKYTVLTIISDFSRFTLLVNSYPTW